MCIFFYRIITEGIAQVIVSQFMFFILCCVTICFWVLSPFFLDEFKLPIAAKYPFPIEHFAVLTLVFFYQIVGIAASATHNVMIDSICVGTIVMMSAQMQRLCQKLSKIGHENAKTEKFRGIQDKEYIKFEEKWAQIEKSKNKNYAEIVKCVFLHRKILK